MADILVIEDEPILLRTIRESLRLAGHEVTAAGSGEQGLAQADAAPSDIILLDIRLPGIDGMEVLRTLKGRGTSSSIIIMTAHGNIQTAVEAMKAGAADFLTKPLDLTALDLVVERVLAQRKVSAQLDYFRGRERAGSALEHIIGGSPPMLRVKQFITRLASTTALASQTPPSVLITGETGTGKDLVARAIHFAGPRSEGAFVHVNCAALPDELVESELFGHVKGAFTDARADRRGLLESAEGGTVFLDEIGHMKPPLQAKLLTALEHRIIRPVGGTRQRQVNIHVISATNRNLEQAIENGEFREDLYHRLRVLTVEMPPLRDRGEDIMELAGYFLHLYATRFGMAMGGFSPEAVDLLRRHHWPGNVRELSHVIESAVLICDGRTIHPDQLNIRIRDRGAAMRVELPGSGADSVEIDFASPDCPKLEDIEHRIIRAAVEYARHNFSRAARILGISRDAIRYRLEKYGQEEDHGQPQ